MTRPVLPLLLLLAVLTAAVRGQTAPGTIVGRVFNPATGEYVRNAQVQIAGTSISTASEGGGEYRLFPVAPGTVTVSANFTGYRTATATVNVAPGATATQDFNLVSTLATAPTGPGDAIKLDAFVVSSEREGSAKAIMD